jgi:hypothetical protein
MGCPVTGSEVLRNTIFVSVLMFSERKKQELKKKGRNNERRKRKEIIKK